MTAVAQSKKATTNSSIKYTKANKDNTKIEILSKKWSWRDRLDSDNFLFRISDENWRKSLMLTVLEWADHPNSLEMEQFCHEHRIPCSTYYKWLHDYPDFKEVVSTVKMYLASRKRIGAITRKYDKDAVYKDLHRYDPSWDVEVNQYWNKMKAIQASIQNQIEGKSSGEEKYIMIKDIPAEQIESKDE